MNCFVELLETCFTTKTKCKPSYKQIYIYGYASDYPYWTLNYEYFKLNERTLRIVEEDAIMLLIFRSLDVRNLICSRLYLHIVLIGFYANHNKISEGKGGIT